MVGTSSSCVQHRDALGEKPSASGCSAPTCSTPEANTLRPKYQRDPQRFWSAFFELRFTNGTVSGLVTWVGGPGQVSVEGIDCPFKSQTFFVRNRRKLRGIQAQLQSTSVQGKYLNNYWVQWHSLAPKNYLMMDKIALTGTKPQDLLFLNNRNTLS